MLSAELELAGRIDDWAVASSSARLGGAAGEELEELQCWWPGTVGTSTSTRLPQRDANYKLVPFSGAGGFPVRGFSLIPRRKRNGEREVPVLAAH